MALRETKPSRVLAALNEAVRQQRSDRTFCTVAYIRMRPNDQGARLTICCAGHPLPLVLRANGSIERAGVPGTLLGIFADPELNTLEQQVEISNQNVAQAEGRFRQARALVQAARAAYFPTVTVGVGMTRTARSPTSATAT